MNTIRLTSTLTDRAAAEWAGKLLDDSSYDLLVTEDADVLKPDGSYLIRFRKSVLPMKHCLVAARNLREAAVTSHNRGTAAGPADPANNIMLTANRRRRIKRDGTVANTIEARPVLSGIVGAFTPTPRNPYCRLSAFTLDNPEKVAASLPMILSASEQFKELMPERYAAQLAYITKTHPDFKVQGTAFTTITVNKNWQTAVHKDAGDLKAGFGVMTVLRSGEFDGCYLCFPQFRVAVDMRSRCICLADVHEWHGNTPFRGKDGTYERLSLVMYYREKMDLCGSASDQLEKVKARKLGDKLL